MSGTVAVVPAAGVGRRMGEGSPKPYRYLGSRPMISYVLSALSKCPEIDQVVIVVAAQDREFCRKEIMPTCNLGKPWQLVIGGSERQESVYKGLTVVQGSAEIVVVHDAARPLVSVPILKACIFEAKRCGACIVGLPVRDTLKEVDEKGLIKRTIDRSCVWLAQTPQVFRYDLLWQAHQKARDENFIGTDDAVLVERLGIAVKMIKGSGNNIKVTYPEDLALVEGFLLMEEMVNRGQ